MDDEWPKVRKDWGERCALRRRARWWFFIGERITNEEEKRSESSKNHEKKTKVGSIRKCGRERVGEGSIDSTKDKETIGGGLGMPPRTWTGESSIVPIDDELHTTVVLADTLVEALMDWNIDRKVPTITVDNCTTNDSMINHLLQKLPTKDMPLDGKVTEMFSGTLYPTSNFYFQKNYDIKVKLDEWVKSPNTLIQDMALSMLRKYDKYWEVCHILIGVAVVLDPRYKMSLVEFFFRKIYHESARFKIDKVRQNCYDLLFDYQSSYTLNESSSSIGSLENTMSSDVHSNVNVDDSLDEFEQFVVSKTSGASNLSATSELDMYLEESLLPRARDFDILNW
ncbi:UNVERIFIED_CONTAM: Zinc finger BED domain-containing protein RICESLEEPER 1 [Sesamum calycinum]|uniref:Zinc finger BED domain-containing protein RICESLEEPER 1 n=1 Tax=Sesamum calycinum TaxID=2727403 RepID=A0AAW2NGD3_9LAMI